MPPYATLDVVLVLFPRFPNYILNVELVHKRPFSVMVGAAGWIKWEEVF